MRAYELVPEAYRQRFRGSRRVDKQTFVEFAREKEILFNRWCASQKAETKEQLRELVLLEEFKNCVPEAVATYLSEQRVARIGDAAVLADEYVLAHKTVFNDNPREARDHVSPRPLRFTAGSDCTGSSGFSTKPASSGSGNSERDCFFCKKPGHVIADCYALERKQKAKPVALPASVSCRTGAKDGLSQLTENRPGLGKGMSEPSEGSIEPDLFAPFRMEGLVATSESGTLVPICILRDTAAAQSLLVEGVLPLSEETSTGENALVRGCGLAWFEAPLHDVYLQSGLVTGLVTVAIRPELPLEGVDMILGNDLAGGEVFPTPIVVNNPVGSRGVNQGDPLSPMPKVFPVCVGTRAQSRKVEEVVDLSDTFIIPCEETVEIVSAGPSATSESTVAKQSTDSIVGETIEVTLFHPVTLADESETQLKVGREQLIEAQKADPSLAKSVAAALPKDEIGASQVVYYWEDGILMRKWAPSADDSGCNTAYQIVVPAGYRAQILSLAHDNVWSGHLGIAKTYYRMLKHFFWPGLKRDVSRHCHSFDFDSF